MKYGYIKIGQNIIIFFTLTYRQKIRSRLEMAYKEIEVATENSGAYVLSCLINK